MGIKRSIGYIDEVDIAFLISFIIKSQQTVRHLVGTNISAWERF